MLLLEELRLNTHADRIAAQVANALRDPSAAAIDPPTIQDARDALDAALAVPAPKWDPLREDFRAAFALDAGR